MQSGSEFHILIMRSEKEWPLRADAICNLLSFLELPQLLGLKKKYRKVQKRSCAIITGRICPKGSSGGISFSHGSILGFFAPQGRHVAPIKVKFGREELLAAKFDLDRFRGGGLGPPKLKKIEIYQYKCPCGAGPLHDFLQNLQGLCASSVYIILPNFASLFR